MRTVTLIVTAFAFGLTASAYPPLPKPKEKKTDAKGLAKSLEGTWEVTKYERGVAGGKTTVMKMPYEMRVVIADGKLTRQLNLKGKDLKTAPMGITLDAKKSPAWFDVAPPAPPKGAKVAAGTMTGLVQVDGDTMTWVYAMRDGERPKTIDGELGALQYRYTLKRVKK